MKLFNISFLFKEIKVEIKVNLFGNLMEPENNKNPMQVTLVHCRNGFINLSKMWK